MVASRASFWQQSPDLDGDFRRPVQSRLKANYNTIRSALKDLRTSCYALFRTLPGWQRLDSDTNDGTRGVGFPF